MPEEITTSMSEVERPNDPYVLRNLSALVGALEEGQLNVDATDGLRNLVKELTRQSRLTDKPVKGALTLTLDIQVGDGATEIRAKFATKVPALKRHRSVMWPQEDGALSMQPALPFTATRIGGGMIRDVTTAQVVRAV